MNVRFMKNVQFSAKIHGRNFSYGILNGLLLIFIVTGPQGTLEASLGLDTLQGRSILRIRGDSNIAKMENPGNSPLARSSYGLPGHPLPFARVIRCG